MKNSGVPIAKEGVPFLLVFFFATLTLLFSGWKGFAIPLGALTLFTLYFFRNPERITPLGNTVVASPADGKIIFVGEVFEGEFLREKALKLSIFMSLWDVHINRVPLDGTVKDIRHHRGRFLAAFEDRASEENERNSIFLETPRGERLVLTQVAGLVARRIVSYPTIGQFVLKGQRMGLIRFGSRCDIYLPLTAEILVKMGEHVAGGETVIAKLEEPA